jgi:hypothetical protein
MRTFGKEHLQMALFQASSRPHSRSNDLIGAKDGREKRSWEVLGQVPESKIGRSVSGTRVRHGYQGTCPARTSFIASYVTSTAKSI